MKSSTIDKNSVIRNFSRAARLYDEYADIQKSAAYELLGRLPENGYSSILEIGCGTGIYTSLLKERFNKSVLKAVDISSEMVRVAEDKLKGGVEFMVADAENMLPEGEFGLITSNASMQWFLDLEAAFKNCSGRLEERGILLFSIFGPQTFWELDAVLKSIFKGKSVPAAQFNSKDALAAMLGRDFKDVVIDEINYTENHSSLAGLLNKIKYTGTAGARSGKDIFIGPGRLKEIEGAYMSAFGGIRATYQVFFCRCEAL